MYRTDFCTLWEKARVGCFERRACILSIVKQITSPGGMHETSAWAWCTRKTQRNRVERVMGGGSGWGIHVNPWLIHVNIWQKPLQYCKVISLQLIKINGKKKKRIHLPMQGTPVWSQAWDIPHATEQLSRSTTTNEAHKLQLLKTACPRAHAT